MKADGLAFSSSRCAITKAAIVSSGCCWCTDAATMNAWKVSKSEIRCKRCTYRAHGGMWDIGIGGLIALVGSSISNRGSGEVRVLPLNVR